MQIQKKLKICNNLLVVMMFLFGSTKSDLTILNEMYNTSASGDGGGGISMLVLVMIKQQCLSHDRSSGNDGSSSGGMAAVARL